MKVRLRQLAVFDAIARLGTVSAASKAVHLSQSAASLALQELEKSLGAQLFNRSRRKLVLNENGRRLQPRARSVLALVRELEDDLDVERLSGVIHVAASPTIGNYILPAICARFLEAHPEVRIDLTVANEPEIINQVDSLTFDIGFIEGVSMRHALRVEPWIYDSLSIIVGPRHWAAGRTITMSRLRKERWYLQSIGASTRHAFTNPYSWLLGSEAISFETNSVEAIKGAVASGLGIGCLSRFAVEDELACGRLREAHVRGFRISRSFNIIAHKHVYKGGAYDAFLRYARAAQSWFPPPARTLKSSKVRSEH